MVYAAPMLRPLRLNKMLQLTQASVARSWRSVGPHAKLP